MEARNRPKCLLSHFYSQSRHLGRLRAHTRYIWIHSTNTAPDERLLKHPMNNETEPDEYYRIKDALLLALGQTEETEQSAAVERALAGLNHAEQAELIDYLALERNSLDMLITALNSVKRIQDQSVNGQASDRPRRSLIRGVPLFFPVP